MTLWPTKVRRQGGAGLFGREGAPLHHPPTTATLTLPYHRMTLSSAHWVQRAIRLVKPGTGVSMPNTSRPLHPASS